MVGARWTAAGDVVAELPAPAQIRLRTERTDEVLGIAVEPGRQRHILEKLGFEVGVQDTGDSQEVQIPVILTIENTPRNIVQRQTIDVLNPGETKTVVFKNLGSVTFARRTTLKVEVTAVPNEKTLTNNSYTYPVIFSLPAP
jgi:hypothetical protein